MVTTLDFSAYQAARSESQVSMNNPARPTAARVTQTGRVATGDAWHTDRHGKEYPGKSGAANRGQHNGGITPGSGKVGLASQGVERTGRPDGGPARVAQTGRVAAGGAWQTDRLGRGESTDFPANQRRLCRAAGISTTAESS